VKQIMYSAYTTAGVDRMVWRFASRRLRILAYHGVCDDHLAGEKWVPPYFVTRSAFAAQMSYLKRHACVLHLSDAVPRLRDNDLPDRAVSITFDDGYANNLHAALPILKQYGMPATIFLATAYMDSGELFPFDRVQLIEQFTRGHATADPEAPSLRDYENAPLDEVRRRIDAWWHRWGSPLTAEQITTLRPLRRDEIAGFGDGLVEFGAHTHSHCILRNETSARRRAEITESLLRVADLTGRSQTVFSYPNGKPGDFAEEDKQVLRGARIAAAVTTAAGSNPRHRDPFELRRYSVGLLHTPPAFAAALTGVQTVLNRRPAAGLYVASR
jgi:peptidoglycan/xylan/chitin deacetylase (PgdA/CDA1 family)